MATAADGDLGTIPSDLASDQHRAERLLTELAMELRRVPVHEHTRYLHLRALALKRAVMRWPDEQPDGSIRLAVIGEVLAMQKEAQDWRRLSPSGRSAAGEGPAGE
ncbi:MAG TPA: hypothetical protein VN894_19835 [Polyangiaceae bacterium]|nr:hypothetical protein [Polyangiaceae bacterium]